MLTVRVPTVQGNSSAHAWRMLACSLMVSACGAGKDSATPGDSALGRDLAMAATDSAAQPKLQDVPVVPTPAEAPAEAAAPVTKPSPAAPKPKPAPKAATPAATPSTTPTTIAPAPPTSGTIAAGTALAFSAGAKVCSNTTAVGEKFTAELSQAVSGTNGAQIPAGATGTFEVVAAKTAKNSGDSTFLRVRLVSVSYGGNSYDVESTLQTATTERVRSASKGTDAKKVGGGAVVGAIAGRVLGKSTKGAVIGAAAGAAVGTAAAVSTADFDTCLNSGAAIAVKLDAPATVRIGS